MTKAGTNKANASQRSFLGKSQKNKAKINAYEKLLALQEKQIRKLRRRVLRHSEKIKEAEALGEQMKDNVSSHDTFTSRTTVMISS